MSKKSRLSDETRFTRAAGHEPPAGDRALRDFRYLVGSINDEAERVWGELWEQLKGGVTPAGVVLPEMREGFKPECGWAEFLEKFWLLKHYLDSVQRFCKPTGDRDAGPRP